MVFRSFVVQAKQPTELKQAMVSPKEVTGKWLAATRLPSISSKTLRVISDVVNRDATSANHLLQGLAKNKEDRTVEHQK